MNTAQTRLQIVSFLICVAVIIVLSARLIHDAEVEGRRPNLDIVGSILSAIGLGLMLLLPPVGAVIAILGSVMVFVGGTGTIVKAVSTVVRRFRQPSEAPAEERE